MNTQYILPIASILIIFLTTTAVSFAILKKRQLIKSRKMIAANFIIFFLLSGIALYFLKYGLNFNDSTIFDNKQRIELSHSDLERMGGYREGVEDGLHRLISRTSIEIISNRTVKVYNDFKISVFVERKEKKFQVGTYKIDLEIPSVFEQRAIKDTSKIEKITDKIDFQWILTPKHSGRFILGLQIGALKEELRPRTDILLDTRLNTELEGQIISRRKEQSEKKHGL